MNVDTDQLATYELKEFGRIYHAIPFDPSCSVALSIEGRTVTRDIERSIQETVFLSPLRSYICNRFNWSTEIFDTIEWEPFSQVYSHFPRSRKFFYQFGWKKLPTGARLHSRESQYDDRCPLCECADESDDHLFRCSHADRKQWRESLVKGIHDKLSTFLDPEQLDMLCLGIRSFLRHDPTMLQHRFPDPSHNMPSADSDLDISCERSMCCDHSNQVSLTGLSHLTQGSHHVSSGNDSLYISSYCLHVVHCI